MHFHQDIWSLGWKIEIFVIYVSHAITFKIDLFSSLWVSLVVTCVTTILTRFIFFKCTFDYLTYDSCSTQKNLIKEKGKIYWYLSKLLEINSQLVKKHYCTIHWVAITNIQQKVYFAYLFFNCWNIEKLNLKLHNLVFLYK
jgi:hypothetical protein